MSTREVNFKLTGDGSDAQKAFSGISKSIDRVGKEVKTGFGSTGGAVQKLGGELQNLGTQLGLAMGLSEVVGLMKQFGAESIAAARESAGATAQLEAVLKSTGGAAGMTKGQLDNLATSLQKTSMFSDEAVMGAESLLLTFKNVGSTVFPQATQAIVDMSQAMGQDLKSSAIQIGKALNDPVEGISALTRVGVTFTEAQKQQIAAMVRVGDVAGAQKMILAELNSEFGGSALAAREAAGGAQDLAVSYGNLQEKFGGLMLAMANSEGAQMAVSFLDKLAAGAEAYSVILNQQIPAIQAHNAGLAEQAAQAAINATTQEELAAAWEQGRSDFDAFKSALVDGAKDADQYNDIIKRGAQGNYYLIDSLTLSADEFANLKTEIANTRTEMASTGPAAVAFISHLNAMQTAATLTAEANVAVTDSIKKQKAAQEAAAAGFEGMTNREKDALEQLYNARAKQPELMTDWGNQVDQEKKDDAEKKAADAEKEGEKIAKALAKGMEKPLNDLGNTISSAVSGAVSQSKTDIASLLGIDPDAGDAVNEDVKRMAAVATGGLGNEWTRLLAEELKGVSGAKAFVDAVKAGDDSAVREEARKLAMDPVVELFDAEQIAAGIEQKLRGEDLAGILNQKVAAILSEKGLEVPPEMLEQATGSMPTEKTATDATVAAGQLSSSFDTVGPEISKKLEPASTALNTLDSSLLATTTNLATFASEIESKFKTAAEKISGFQTTIKQAKWGDVGSAIVKGLVAGINANLYQVNEVLKDLAKEAIDAARDELGIKSPSKEFFQIAEMIVAGLTGGVDSKGPSFQKAIGKLLQIDRDTFNLKDMVGFAADEVEEVMEGLNMEDSKVKFALKEMKDALRSNLSTVAKGSGDELKKVLMNAVGSWEKAGFSGEAGKGLNSGMDAFVKQIIALRTEFPKMAEAARQANLEKLFGGIGKFANEATGGADELAKRIAVLQTQIRQGGESFSVEGQIMNRDQAQARLGELIGQQTDSAGDLAAIKKIQQALGGIQSTRQLTGLLNSPMQMTMPQIAQTTKAILDSLIGQMGTLVKSTQNNNNFTLNITSQTTRENLLADFELLQSLLPSST